MPSWHHTPSHAVEQAQRKLDEAQARRPVLLDTRQHSQAAAQAKQGQLQPA